MTSEIFSEIYNKALDILSRREHSVLELKQKLKKKYNFTDNLNEVISRLKENNLLNDYRFTEAYVIYRKRRGFGPIKISNELQSKGISEATIVEVLDSEGGWMDAANKAFIKRFKEGPSKDIKILLKQKNFLHNRGFSFQEIESVLTDDMLWFNAMSYEVLARKYRPSNFDEVVGQDHIIKALVNSIDQNKLHQAFIFSGTRGVGKTTLGRILAKCLNCLSFDEPTSSPCNECANCEEIRIGRSLDFFEQDAASQRGIDAMKELLQTVPQSPSNGRYKIYLLDEAHQLTTESFNALLKNLEEPPKHVVFILATTNPEKLPKTVQSRCLQLNLKTVHESILEGHLKKILKHESIEFDDDSVKLISKSAKGSVRDALTLLDQSIAYGNGSLNADDIQKLLGTIDDSMLFELIDSIVDGDSKNAFNLLSEIEKLSPEYDSILKDIIGVLHQISLHQALDNSNDSRVANIAKKIDKEFCQLLYEIGINSYSKFSVHPNSKEALELCVLRMLTFNPLQKLSEGTINQGSDGTEKKNVKIAKDNQQESKVEKEKLLKNDNFKIENNKDWINIFNILNISPFTKNIFGAMSYKSFDNNLLILISDSKSLSDISESIISELKDAFKNLLSVNITIDIHEGEIQETPISYNIKSKRAATDKSTQEIENNKDIQSFIKKFNGKIKKDTIKPIKWIKI